MDKKNIASDMERSSLKSSRKLIDETSPKDAKYAKLETDESSLSIGEKSLDNLEISNPNEKNVTFNIELEPLLRDNPRRFVILPIQYNDMWRLYKKAEETYWTAEEIDLGLDFKEFESYLTADDRRFVRQALEYLTGSEGCIKHNLIERCCQEVQVTEARFFFGFQMAMKNIHYEMYSEAIRTLTKHPDEREQLVNSIRELPCVKRKNDWISKWVNSESTNFGDRLIALAAMEGILSRGSIAVIYWLKGLGIVPGLALAGDYITRDKKNYCDFACILYKHLKQKPSEERIIEIIREAVEIEKEYITAALPVKLLDLEDNSIHEHLEFLGDQLLTALKLNKIYNTKNPIDFVACYWPTEREERKNKVITTSNVDSAFSVEAEF